MFNEDLNSALQMLTNYFQVNQKQQFILNENNFQCNYHLRNPNRNTNFNKQFMQQQSFVQKLNK